MCQKRLEILEVLFQKYEMCLIYKKEEIISEEFSETKNESLRRP